MIDTTVLFHANCPDGYAAAYACWLRWHDQAQYLPVFYGKEPPQIPLEHNIYIVDFSYPETILKALLSARLGRRKRGEMLITVLDHHTSAQRDLISLQRQELPGLDIRFDLEESGASLTWKHLNGYASLSEEGADPGAMPMFFAYIRDRDLWQWQLTDSKAISMAYWAIDKDFLTIEQFAQDLDEAKGYDRIVTQGAAMQRYADRLVQEQVARATIGIIGGYAVPLVNATTLFSEVGDYLCTINPDVLFCAYYMDRKDGQRQWGLRGHDKVDLSQIAKSYGGGGHPNAAGFVTGQDWRGDH